MRRPVTAALLVLAALLSSAAAFAVPSGAAQCGVEIIGLEVSGNTTGFTFRNTGQSTEAINHSIIINGNLLYNDSSTLNSSEQARVSREYGFGVGRYEVRALARADCGSNHSATLVHWVFGNFSCANPDAFENQERCDYATGRYLRCSGGSWSALSQNQYCTECTYHCGDGVCSCGESYSSCAADCQSSCQEGYTNSYACDGSIQQRAYRYVNCTTVWVPQTLCPNGCYNGTCIGTPGGSPGSCGVQIVSLDYTSQLVNGTTAYATVTSRNTGESTTRINTSAWLDGSLRDYRYQNVHPGTEFAAALSYPAGNEGLHSLVFRAKSGCGSEDVKSAGITTISSSSRPAGPAPPQTPPAQQGATMVSFYPSFIDTSIYSSRVVGINIITSRPQNFIINASGLPAGWVQYNSIYSVNNEMTVYVYVTPRGLGSYNLSVTARPESENLSFSASIPIFVAETGAPSQQGTDTIGGFWGAARALAKTLIENPAAAAAVIIVLLAIVLAIGHLKLRRGRWPF